MFFSTRLCICTDKHKYVRAGGIADISHRQWCTLFQAGAPFAFGIENATVGPLSAFSFFAILSRIYALFGAPFTGLNSVMVKNIRYAGVHFYPSP